MSTHHELSVLLDALLEERYKAAARIARDSGGRITLDLRPQRGLVAVAWERSMYMPSGDVEPHIKMKFLGSAPARIDMIAHDEATVHVDHIIMECAGAVDVVMLYDEGGINTLTIQPDPGHHTVVEGDRYVLGHAFTNFNLVAQWQRWVGV